MVDRTKEIVKGAVATTRGWVNPATGELLVSIRGLPDAIEWVKGPINQMEMKAEEPKVEAKVDLESKPLEVVAKAKKLTKKTP